MEIQFSTIFCATCHIPFAITQDLCERLRGCHNEFRCPMGHINYFPGMTNEEKLRKELRDKVNEIANLNLQLNSKTRKTGKKRK